MTSCNAENILTALAYRYIVIACIAPGSVFSKGLHFGLQLAVQSNA
jgi:hypothetical protein